MELYLRKKTYHFLSEDATVELTPFQVVGTATVTFTNSDKLRHWNDDCSSLLAVSHFMTKSLLAIELLGNFILSVSRISNLGNVVSDDS